LLDLEESTAERTQEFPDLRTLFAQFVAERKDKQQYTDTFAAAFLERGDRALTDAMLTQDAPKPEEDNVG
jgi:CHASE1-domain containing sensor protein